jgi:hypothetical protein
VFLKSVTLPTLILMFASFARPERALILLRDRCETLVEKSLHTLAAISLGGVDVPLRIGRDTVDSVKLSGLPAAVAKARQDFQRITEHDVDLLVRAVDEVQILLLWISGERNIPDGTIS